MKCISVESCQIEHALQIFSGFLERLDALARRHDDGMGRDAEITAPHIHMQGVGQPAAREDGHVDFRMLGGNGLADGAHAHIPRAAAGEAAALIS